MKYIYSISIFFLLFIQIACETDSQSIAIKEIDITVFRDSATATLDDHLAQLLQPFYKDLERLPQHILDSKYLKKHAVFNHLRDSISNNIDVDSTLKIDIHEEDAFHLDYCLLRILEMRVYLNRELPSLKTRANKKLDDEAFKEVWNEQTYQNAVDTVEKLYNLWWKKSLQN